MKDETIDLARFRVGTSYSRAEVADVGDVSPKNFGWATGISLFANAVLLFVTLEKTEYTYRDHFSGSLFWWQSQTRQDQSDRTLGKLANGELQAQLFVRIREKERGKTQKFVYCGRLSTPLMSGEYPVTCQFEALDVLQDPPELLSRIYAWRPDGLAPASEGQRHREIIARELNSIQARGQGRLRDYQRRRAVELHAMEIAKLHYSELGYLVTDTSSTKPFDLLCEMPGIRKRVEVKGSQSAALTVDVTVAEVLSARRGEREGYSTDLFIVHSISLKGNEDFVSAQGGIAKKIENWVPAEAHLDPTAYRYSVQADFADL